MPRFFITESPAETVTLSGEDAQHIQRSLRMRVGETVTLCDGAGKDYLCEIAEMAQGSVRLQVLKAEPSRGEPSLSVTLYQSFPKADKMDFIAQKFVETGACELVPVLSERCVSRPDQKALSRKTARWQKIAEEAAKQCGRGKIPRVGEAMNFREAVARAAADSHKILFYEGGGAPLNQLMQPGWETLSIFIGPEGGYEPAEVELAREHGFAIASLGPRIFRAETAPIAALAAIMYASGNL